jgi:hypothetical protein
LFETALLARIVLNGKSPGLTELRPTLEIALSKQKKAIVHTRAAAGGGWIGSDQARMSDTTFP